MRVALLSSTVIATPPPRYGGLEQVVWLLAREMAAAGHDVTLVAHPESTAPDGIRLAPYRQDETGAWGLPRDGLSDADVVHDHSWERWSWALAPGDPTRTYVYTWHGAHLSWEAPPPEVTICGVSRWHAAELQAELGRPVRGVPNGIDLDAFPVADGAGDGSLCYLARMDPAKGLHRAIALVRQTGHVLHVAGTEHFSPDPAFVRAVLARMDGRRIVFHGDLGHAEKVALLHRCSALLHLAPTWPEPFGLAPVEAMACGRPVVAYATGALTETVRSGGVLVGHPDELPAAVRRAVRISPAVCRDNARLFPAHRMAEGYVEVYRAAASAAGRTVA